MIDPEVKAAIERVRRRAQEQLARVERGELPLHHAAAELGMMPFELEAIGKQTWEASTDVDS